MEAYGLGVAYPTRNLWARVRSALFPECVLVIIWQRIIEKWNFISIKFSPLLLQNKSAPAEINENVSSVVAVIIVRMNLKTTVNKLLNFHFSITAEENYL